MGVCMSFEGAERREQKRLAKEMLNAEVKAAQLLADMPGRLCSNGATRTCCLHTKQGCKGINQDSMLVWEGFGADESVFLAVFDGHGPNGHMVANKVRDCLPTLLTLPIEVLLEEGFNSPHHHVQKPIEMINIINFESLDANNHSGEVQSDNKDSVWTEDKVTAAFHKMDESLKMHPKISCTYSGTTAVAMLVQDKDLMVGSVGDSRAILGTRSVDGSLVAHQLTIDLKPDSPGEIERIQKCQGRVFALEDEPHIPRLWLPHANAPGLAMARAFGDFCLKEHGLIATPQIIHKKLSEQDEFIVLATDGVWDVLSNAEVIDAIVSCGSKEEAARCVVEAATNAWTRRKFANRMDDCAVVCHFLKDVPDLSSIPKELQKPKEGLNFDGEDAKHSSDNTRHESTETNRQLVRYDTLVGIDGLPEAELLPPAIPL